MGYLDGIEPVKSRRSRQRDAEPVEGGPARGQNALKGKRYKEQSRLVSPKKGGLLSPDLDKAQDLKPETTSETPQAQNTPEEKQASSQKKGARSDVQTTARGWISEVVGASGPEDYEDRLTAWQAEHGVAQTGVADAATLRAMELDLLEISGVKAEAKTWYKKTAAAFFHKVQKASKRARSEGGEALDADNMDAEPLTTILQELGWESSSEEALGVSLDSFSKKSRFEASDAFIARALSWQIDQRLGLDLDALLGTSALVLMGLDTGNKTFAVLNVDNLEKNEQEDSDDLLGQDDTMGKRLAEVITVDGQGKRSGDLTGDDGVAFGIAHATNPGKLGRFLDHVGTQAADEATGLPAGAEVLERIFGTPDVEAIKAKLLLDRNWKSKGRNKKNKQWAIDNEYLAVLARDGTLEQLIAFLRDDDIKRYQAQYAKGDWSEKITAHKKKFDGPVSVGTAALLAAVGNSSANGLDKTLAGAEHERQLQIGINYLEGRPEEGTHKQDLKAWKSAFNQRGGTINVHGKHRLKRLLLVLQKFGAQWDNPYKNLDQEM